MGTLPPNSPSLGAQKNLDTQTKGLPDLPDVPPSTPLALQVLDAAKVGVDIPEARAQEIRSALEALPEALRAPLDVLLEVEADKHLAAGRYKAALQDLQRMAHIRYAARGGSVAPQRFEDLCRVIAGLLVCDRPEEAAPLCAELCATWLPLGVPATAVAEQLRQGLRRCCESSPLLYEPERCQGLHTQLDALLQRAAEAPHSP